MKNKIYIKFLYIFQYNIYEGEIFMVKYLLKCYSSTGQELVSQELLCNNFKEAISVALNIRKRSSIHIKQFKLIPISNSE